ncbi:spherulin-1A [Xylariomycetidae sp. FL2044]|nr:spherulin-1A [Xylariomycetidae sp. FL2044]
MPPSTSTFEKLWFLSLTIASFVAATNWSVDTPLDIALKTAAVELDRIDLLTPDSTWVFDFFAQDSYTYTPGAVINANAASFPATVGNGMAMAWVNLGPCAMQPPHYHPRGSNYIVVIEGTIDTYMVSENGARLVTNTLTPGKMTIFPKGSLHSMQNTGCANATIISSLNFEDPGTFNVANGLFSLPSDIIMAAFGGNRYLNISDFNSTIPPVGTGMSLGSARCLSKCFRR